jgi:hypothetical protein
MEIEFPSGQAVGREEWNRARHHGSSSFVRAIALDNVALVSVYALEAELARKARPAVALS